MRYFIFTFFLLWSSVLFSQDLSVLCSEISECGGNAIVKNFQQKEEVFKRNTGNQSTLKILVLPVKNALNEFTQISEAVSPRLTNVFQNKVKSSFSRFSQITIDYADDRTSTNGYDYVLHANYSISSNEFILENIVFRKPDNTLPIVFDRIVCPVNTSSLRLLDYAVIAENIEQLSRSIAVQFRNLEGLKKVKLENFVELKSKIAGEFAEFLSANLETDLSSLAGIETQRNTQRQRSLNNLTQYVITGVYSKMGDKIKIISYLKEPSTNVTKGSATAYLSAKYLKENNILLTLPNEDEFSQRQEIIKNTSITNDFTVDIWTNKGNSNPIFKENDILKISIEVSEACYIRVIDVFADGTQILLIDNMLIASDKVGRPYTIPNAFRCSEPFGGEIIMVLAQTSQKLPPLNTVDFYGYRKITDNLKKSRGFRNDVRKAEKHINVTTMAN